MTQVTKTSFGYDERAKKLKRERMLVKAYVVELIEHHVVPVFCSNDTVLMPDPEPIYQHVFEKLQNKYSKFSNYRLARCHFSSLINSGNRDSKWLLPVPSFIYRYTREALFRNEKWFMQSKAVNAWTQKWLVDLSYKPATKTRMSPASLLGNCLMSSMLYGGLCIPEALTSLSTKLTKDNKPLKNDGNNVYIELMFENKSQPHNIVFKGRSKTLKRWYPDPFTLCWINHFLFTLNSYQCEVKFKNAWALMESIIDGVDQNVLDKVTTKEAWCKASVGVIENLPQVELSQTLIGYLVGSVTSVSLPTGVNDAIWMNCYRMPDINGFTYKAKSTNSSLKPTFDDAPFNAEMAIEEIGDALAKNYKNGHKKSSAQAIALLEEVQSNYLNHSLDLLISWLLDRLNKTLRVSSVLRYWYAIGKTWLAHTLSIELHLLDSEEFGLLYKDMIDTGKSANSRYYNASRFDEFHCFMHRQYGYPLLSAPLNDSSKLPSPFVIAIYVPQAAFHKILESISQTVVDDSLKQSLQVLFILAIRTGMRIGEISKLRIDDIEDSIEKWVFVRNNKFGNNKSTSSLRKIPLNVLLHENEEMLIREYLSIRRHIGQGENILMFSKGNSFHIPLNSNWVGRVFSVIASHVMNVNCTFHALRHTALSNLQLLLEDDKDMLNRLAYYSPQQITRIQTVLANSGLNSSKRDKYWIMAGFAGHSTPSTTLTSYLHFTDYLVGRAIRKAFYSIPKQAIKTASGLSSNALTRLDTRSKNENEWHDNLLNKVEVSLKGAIVQTTNIATKTEDQDTHSNNPKYNKPKIAVSYSVLKDAENEAIVDELVDRYNIEPQTIEYWIKNALELYKKSTCRGAARLVSSEARKFRGNKIMAPVKPATTKEMNEVDTAIPKFEDIYKNNKTELYWVIDYFINYSNRSSPFINFAEPSDVSRFLSTLQTVFPAERWHLVVYMHENSIDENNRQWDLLLKKAGLRSEKVSTETKRRYDTKGKLRLRHPDEFEIKKRKGVTNYSSRTLAYILHMLAIMIGPIKYT
jgi:integrase